MNLVRVADEWRNNEQLGAEAAVERVLSSAMGLMEEFISQTNESFTV